MDLHGYVIQQEQQQKPIHHEASILRDSKAGLEVTKQLAYKAMSELEGWCSKEKAGILIDYIALTDANIVVEIGVFGGKSLVPMAFALKNNGHGKIYGIDPWSVQESLVGLNDVNKEYWSRINHNHIYENLVRKVFKFGLQDQIDLIRTTSADAPIIENIDILHIDGNHHEDLALIDLNKWVPLVRSGGLIVFDDLYWDGSTLPVDWLNEHCSQLAEFRGDNVWGVWVKP